MEEFIDQDRFEQGLLWAILFQPQILVPDIFLFISNRLQWHVSGNGKSLFEAGVQAGLIIPSFRDPETSSFIHALTTIEDQGILGLMPHEVNRRLAHRLDRASRSMNFQCTHWPTSRLLAQSYEEKLSGILLPDDLPLSALGLDEEEQESIQEVWREARPWRHDAFGEAVRSSPGGVRRGALMSAIGRSVGLTGPLHDIREIFRAVADAGYTRNRLSAIRGVCRLMNDCYLYNLASEHQNDMDFPQLDAWARLVLAATGADRTDTPHSTWPTFEHTVRMPSPASLLALDPRELIAVRSDVYLDYDAALVEWQAEPVPINESRLRLALDSYSSAIRSACHASHSQEMSVTYGSSVGRHGKLGVATLAAATSAAASALELEVESLSAKVLALAGAGVAALIALGESGYACYQQVSAARDLVDLPVRIRANPEVSTPT
ncbi:hypothetical protein [Frankia gtarii]|uniref:hypothetical protein n=1 Tax=Frankia gtarii TaxID=2950102 RepID=UPI0021C15903|nr:hypothetical protein [Frankia gtarii]